jgi:hypothetical protein
MTLGFLDIIAQLPEPIREAVLERAAIIELR